MGGSKPEDLSSDLKLSSVSNMANSAANAQHNISWPLERVENTLFESVRHGDVEEAKTILQSVSEVDINHTSDTQGRTLLHLACEHGHINMVRWLVSLGADVNMAGHYHIKSTPLSLAVLKNHTSIVSALVSEFGCDPNDGVSLHRACKHGNLRMVKTLLEHGASVNDNSVDVDGNTLLHLAAKNETMQALFKDIDHNIKNKEGRTPLHIACVYGNLNGVKQLIEQGAKVNAKDNCNKTPLSLAILNNHTGIVSALLKLFECDPNDGVSLHTACEHGDLSMVKTLIECGASVYSYSRDVYGNTPLHATARNERNETTQALLKYLTGGPNIINAEGRTPLHIACMCGNLGGVKLLIKHGARVDVKDIQSNTPLTLAAVNNHTSIVSTLVSEFGCDINLHAACRYGNLSMVKTLIECGANVNDKDVDGDTPLHLTAEKGANMAMQALLRNFENDPNIKNAEGRTSLHIACMCGNLGGVKLLIKYGARMNVKDFHSNTPLSLAVLHNHTSIVSALVSEFCCNPNDGVSLHTACKHGNLSMAITLLEHGASVDDNNIDVDGNTPAAKNETMQALFKDIDNIKNRDGRTPLHIACMCGNSCRVKLLILQGAEMNAKDIYFNTPLSLAILNNHTNIVSALVSEFGCDPSDGLHRACEHGNLQVSMIKTLIECGTSKDVGGNTLLHLTTKYGRNKTVQAILKDFESDPGIKNKEGMTPLHIACKHGNLGGVRLLIKHGASVNDLDTHSNTPLSLAVQHVSHHEGIIITLVTELGCDPNDGVSLHTACKYNDISSVETLVKCGASVNDRDVEGNTPLYYGGYNTTLTLLSEFKCDPNVINKQDISPLHCACIEGDSKKVGLLIEYGARVNNKNAQGNTPLELAVQNENDEVASLLLNNDELICSIDLIKGKFLYLCVRVRTAIENGQDKAVTALLNHNGELNSVYERETGWSLLHEAAWLGNRMIMELLIREYGMSPLLVDEEGNTLCSKRGHSDCVPYLLHDFHSPVYARNRAGKTVISCSTAEVRNILDEYILEHQDAIEKEYKLMQKLAATRYSGSH